MLLLLTFCCWKHACAEAKLSQIQARLINMLKTKQRSYYRRTIRNSLDLREHRLFHTEPQLQCCPTITEKVPRMRGINQQGLVLELFRMPNWTQTFYESVCHPQIKNRPCQYIDPRIAYATRCIQQYSYVYGVGRTYRSNEQFRLDYVRIPSGCKCQVVKEYLKKRKKKSVQ
jgi:hypothetical protein